MARLAPKVLGDATSLVASFLRQQMTSEGAFADRQGRSDLYYTVFGLEALLALQEALPVDKTQVYLRQQLDHAALDFVHLCSLARCAASLELELECSVFSLDEKATLLSRVENYRTPNGGYHGTPGKTSGSAYGALLAYGAYADMGFELPESERLLASLAELRLDDGSYANEPGMKEGTTTSTAAAVVITQHLTSPVCNDAASRQTGDWLLQRIHLSGGFLAVARAPLPDLLSTATALHALETLQRSFEHLKEPCLDFVDTLWSAQGGFHGHWADDHLDVEYTSYGLLALGHLS